jgi:hypothetical protein
MKAGHLICKNAIQQNQIAEFCIFANKQITATNRYSTKKSTGYELKQSISCVFNSGTPVAK